MITNKNLTANKSWDKKFRKRSQQQETDNNRQYNIKNEDNGDKDNCISQMM